MNKIRVLTAGVANKIAAGEVVERPASVIKELVENSIDAGATLITVEITDGGLTYMRVADNGIGMSKEDAKNCFLRHATSKIYSADDLFAISTLGFRGEAMASIAAVGKVVLKTHRKDDDFGTQINIDGGEYRSIAPCGCPDGTCVEVSDLFYNVPARLKFMKAGRTEASYVSDYVLRMILARPDISFKFINNGTLLYHSKGNGKLKDAVYSVYGAEIIPHLRALEYSDGYVKIYGYICNEQLTKTNRTHQSFFVNGRYIRSQKLSASLSNAYDTRIMSGRFPVAILNFEIDFKEVDVNVHPNKMEVKFSDESRVAGALHRAAVEALGAVAVPTYESVKEKRAENTEPEIKTEPTAQEKEKLFSMLMSQADFTQSADEHTNAADAYSQGSVEDKEKTETQPHTEPKKDEIPVYTVTRTETKPYEQEIIQHELIPTQVEFEANPYEIIGSVYDSFWLISQNENLFILDQHAAHERMIYEQFMRGELKSQSQRLLLPITLKLTGEEYEIFSENRDLFFEFGFEAEDFGALTVRITAVPHILSRAEDAGFFHDAIALLTRQRHVTLHDMKRDALIQASCKAAVKLGNAVPKQMIESILAEYNRGEIPLTCPHGRPVMIVITKKEMFKKFKRIL